MPRLIQTVMADEEPRGLGCQVGNQHQGGGPEPLDREGDAVSHLALDVETAPQDARGDKLTDGPAEVDVRGHVAAQVCRADLGRIRRAERREHAPGQTAHDLSDEQDLGPGCEEGQEDEGVEEGHGDDQDPSVSVLGSEVAIEKASKYSADGAAHAQPRLPGARDLPPNFTAVPVPEFSLELWVREEIAHEDGIVAIVAEC